MRGRLQAETPLFFCTTLHYTLLIQLTMFNIKLGSRLLRKAATLESVGDCPETKGNRESWHFAHAALYSSRPSSSECCAILRGESVGTG